jgi:hypothetical protein
MAGAVGLDKRTRPGFDSPDARVAGIRAGHIEGSTTMRMVLKVLVNDQTGALVAYDGFGMEIARMDGRVLLPRQMERLERILQHAMDEIAADGGYDVEGEDA